MCDTLFHGGWSLQLRYSGLVYGRQAALYRLALVALMVSGFSFRWEVENIIMMIANTYDAASDMVCICCLLTLRSREESQGIAALI